MLNKCFLSDIQDGYASVEVRGSDVSGRGAFAGEPIARGLVVMPLTGKVLQRNEFDASDYSLHVLQIDADAFLLAQGGADDYINHSCSPNLAFTEDGQAYYALRDIAAGEELLVDYSTSEDDPDWSFDCGCGAASCRGRVTGFGNLARMDKQRLIQHALPYIRRQYKAD